MVPAYRSYLMEEKQLSSTHNKAMQWQTILINCTLFRPTLWLFMVYRKIIYNSENMMQSKNVSCIVLNLNEKGICVVVVRVRRCGVSHHFPPLCYAVDDGCDLVSQASRVLRLLLHTSLWCICSLPSHRTLRVQCVCLWECVYIFQKRDPCFERL